MQALIICPTRELADQVAVATRNYARCIHNVKVLTLCGGMPFGPQIGSLEHGAHIVVGTPGRLEEHLRKGNLDLSELEILVLDEADRMLEMGFQDSIDNIVAKTPSSRQTLLFSATYPPQIQQIAERVTRNAKMVVVKSEKQQTNIQQAFFKTESQEERIKALRLLLLEHNPESCVVFCRTKRDTQELAETLQDHGFVALALHGDLEQRDRDQALVRFANKSASVLVATDVAARGLDIDALDLVINFDMARDTEVHVHRIGRTGRAGNKGLACTLYANRDARNISDIEHHYDIDITPDALPDESVLNHPAMNPAMQTLQIDGGKKQKVRPGDILGCLTGEGGISGDEVGKINIFSFHAYVAVKRSVAKKALRKIEQGKLKGRSFRARLLRDH